MLRTEAIGDFDFILSARITETFAHITPEDIIGAVALNATSERAAPEQTPFDFMTEITFDAEPLPTRESTLRIPFGPHAVKDKRPLVTPRTKDEPPPPPPGRTTTKNFKTPFTDNSGAIIFKPDTSVTVDD